MKYSYPLHLDIKYSNDKEYRQCIRQVFLMDAHLFPDTSNLDLDDVTQDEMMYDSQSANKMMDFVYKHTNAKNEFINLYTQAASFMFSTDMNIGLTILFGYDYLDLFHPVLRLFFDNPSDTNLTQSIEYIQLYDKLYKK